jgi:hypothetical protein
VQVQLSFENEKKTDYDTSGNQHWLLGVQVVGLKHLLMRLL